MESILITGPVDQQVNQRYCISTCTVQVNPVRQTSQTTAHQHMYIVLCTASMMLTDLLCMCLCTSTIMYMCVYLYVPYEIA